jgi:hypothetical protein
LQALGKDAASAAEAAEVVYHLYLGWYERHRFKPTASAEAHKQLRIVGSLIGIELPGEGDGP